MSPGIDEDDYDSERDILILEELLDNYSLSLPVIESYHFDIPSFSRPPAKPPNGNTGILNIKMIGDISDQKPFAKCPMMIHGKNIPILDVPLFHFYPLDQFKYEGNRVKLSDLKKALRGRHPMLILVQYSWKFEDSCQRILSSKSPFPQLQLGIKFRLGKGSYVLLKVSPWKRVVRFGKRGKLDTRYVGPFKVLERIRDVAYKLDFPEELSRVHNMFYVSNLKKCHANEPLAVPLNGLHFDDKLHFVE
nr:putative reverse transcriptase domain-containing protein [Tanacetum cinerariifolium]